MLQKRMKQMAIAVVREMRRKRDGIHVFAMRYDRVLGGGAFMSVGEGEPAQKGGSVHTLIFSAFSRRRGGIGTSSFQMMLIGRLPSCLT